MSAIEMPTFAGASALPVSDTTPDSACTSMSYAFLSRCGPSGPYPEIPHHTSREFRSASASYPKPESLHRARREVVNEHIGAREQLRAHVVIARLA